jgi:nucleoside-diphosphate-sugar epimerase
MTILVTGASGFIGGHVVSQLAKQKAYRIIATGRSNTDRFHAFEQVQYVSCDLSHPVPKQACDVCIHVAGLADDQSTAEQLEQNNVVATERLLQAIPQCKVFIYISSASVYNFADGKIKHEHDATLEADLSSYGRSKLTAEFRLKESNIPSVYIVRPRAVYGPGDRVLMPRILKLVRQRRIVVPGAFHALSSLTHVQNLFEAIRCCVEQAKPGHHTYNIADSTTYRLKEVIGAIAHRKYNHKNFMHVPMPIVKASLYLQQALGKKSVVTEQSLNYMTQDSVLAIDKAQTELGYTAAFNFFSSLEQLDMGR